MLFGFNWIGGCLLWPCDNFDHFFMLLLGISDSFFDVLVRYDDFGFLFFGGLLSGFIEYFGLSGSFGFRVTLLHCFLVGLLDLSPNSLQVGHVLFVIKVVLHLSAHNEF